MEKFARDRGLRLGKVKSRGQKKVTHENHLRIFNPISYSLFHSNPQSALFTTPRNPLFGVLHVRKNIYLCRMSEETRFPYMVYTRFMQLQH